MPPDTAPEKVAIVQKALADLDNDADYKADAMKTIKFVPHFLVDDKSRHLFQSTMSPDPKLRALVQNYIAIGERLSAPQK